MHKISTDGGVLLVWCTGRWTLYLPDVAEPIFGLAEVPSVAPEAREEEALDTAELIGMSVAVGRGLDANQVLVVRWTTIEVPCG